MEVFLQVTFLWVLIIWFVKIDLIPFIEFFLIDIEEEEESKNENYEKE